SFPDGTPEQITSGPTEEEGVSVAPDGRSLVSSVGTRRSTIWIHAGTQERPISSEGYALSPQLSHDGARVFYLVARDLMLSATGDTTLTGTIAVPIHGGTPRKICGIGDCRATWSTDGRFFYVSNYVTNTRSASSLDNEKTLAIPVPPGQSLPDFTGLTSALST